MWAFYNSANASPAYTFSGRPPLRFLGKRAFHPSEFPKKGRLSSGKYIVSRYPETINWIFKRLWYRFNHYRIAREIRYGAVSLGRYREYLRAPNTKTPKPHPYTALRSPFPWTLPQYPTVLTMIAPSLVSAPLFWIDAIVRASYSAPPAALALLVTPIPYKFFSLLSYASSSGALVIRIIRKGKAFTR